MKIRIDSVIGFFLILFFSCTGSGSKVVTADNSIKSPCGTMDSVLIHLTSRFIVKNPLKEINSDKIDIAFEKLAPNKLTNQEKKQFLGKFEKFFEEDDVYFYNLQVRTDSYCVINYLEDLYGYSTRITSITYDCKLKPVEQIVISIAHADAGVGYYANSIFSNDTTFTQYYLNFEYSDDFDSDNEILQTICTKDSFVQSYYTNANKGFVMFDSISFHRVDTTYTEPK